MKILNRFLAANPFTEYFRFQWVDYSGISHAKVIPKAHCVEIATNESRLFLPQNCLIVPISTAPECFPSGPQRWELSADWSSLRVCGFKPNHATVMCFLTQVEPQLGTPFEKCPRTALGRVLDSFAGGPEILVGYEIEFVLLDQNSNIAKSLDRVTGFASMAGLRGERLLLMEEICNALQKSGIRVHDFHSEVPDQLEIVLRPASPMEAIDSLMLAQETIRTVAIAHGVKASMAPRPVFNGPQNGLHTHISLNPPSDHTEPFLQGVLESFKPVCAFGMPNVDSYVRVTDDGAGCFIGWGTENRDLPIRRIKASHLEFRFVDATANQYLFLAALLSSGLEGMQTRAELRYKDCMEFQENLTPQKLREFGMSEKMPNRLHDTIEALKRCEKMRGWLGESLLTQYIQVKEKELEKWEHVSDEERRQKFLLFF
jgi:glutamine synthetase